MLKEIELNPLYGVGNKELGISDTLTKIYDDLGAYVHSRGIPTIGMGLMGSNFPAFNRDAFKRFLTLFISVAHICVVALASFFPAAIIYVPAFAKFGHLYPTWLPRKHGVHCIRSVLSEEEIVILKRIAERNTWFKQVVIKVDSLPDLTHDQIEHTYQSLIEIKNALQRDREEGIKEYTKTMMEVNDLLN